MARKPRIESSDGLYHVINRGNFQIDIFESEGAKFAFERALFEVCSRSSWDLLAYCIMTNHFHLCIGTPQGNLSAGMRWLQATFASRFNRFRKQKGHLFEGRFTSQVVQPGSHLTTVINYIHLNPGRVGLAPKEALDAYRWSSLYFFLGRQGRKPPFLDASWMDYLGDITDDPEGWRRYLDLLRLRLEEDPKELEKIEKQLNAGWCLGDRHFKQSLVKEYLVNNGAVHMENQALSEFNELQWTEILSRALTILEKGESDLRRSRKAEPWKLAIASMMKRNTSVPNRWLTERLSMGVPNALSSSCGRYRKDVERSCPFAGRLAKMEI